MIELSPLKKNKVCLQDYDYQKDIENRLLMASFTALDFQVLEEILFSPPTFSVKKLAKNLTIEEADLLPILDKLGRSGLFTLSFDTLIVDKEMRKYYESQILKFDEEFHPGIDFLQSLLRKVPIHILPTWYAISRSSNNILDSIVEKYLLTPQIYQRHLQELNSGDPIFSGIIQDVHTAPNFRVPAQNIIEKYHLSREEFEEYMLLFEFNFACCLGYYREQDQWKEQVMPFYEWQEYLSFLRKTTPQKISPFSKINRLRPSDFAFIKDMTHLLSLAKKQPIAIKSSKEGYTFSDTLVQTNFLLQREGLKTEDLFHLFSKVALLQLAEIKNDKLYVLEASDEWLKMSLEDRAVYLHRHPLNRLLSIDLPLHAPVERWIKEAEKSIVRVLHSGWVFYEDFVKSVHVPLDDPSVLILKRAGRGWKYPLPQYAEEELSLIKATLFEWLFEIGAVAPAIVNEKESFCVTAFGQTLFGR